MIPMNAIVSHADDPLMLVLVVHAAEDLDAVSRLICGDHQVICNRLSARTPALFLEKRDRSVTVTRGVVALF